MHAGLVARAGCDRQTDGPATARMRRREMRRNRVAEFPCDLTELEGFEQHAFLRQPFDATALVLDLHRFAGIH